MKNKKLIIVVVCIVLSLFVVFFCSKFIYGAVHTDGIEDAAIDVSEYAEFLAHTGVPDEDINSLEHSVIKYIAEDLKAKAGSGNLSFLTEGEDFILSSQENGRFNSKIYAFKNGDEIYAYTVFEIKNIKKSFGEDLEVLQDISLAVEEGEVVSILGPSGSGKSTLLRCATFLEQIDSGSIAYGGKVYVENDTAGNAKKPERAKILEAQSNFGLVFQDFNLFPHFSVLKNVMDAPVKNQKRPKQEVEKEARALLAKMGLEGKEDAYPCELSGGQKQRVAIARALALRPKMLYFDEPTSALDPEITAEILRVLKGLAAEKMTMVIVTHEIDFARAVSDRVIFMDGGKVVEEGRPEEVIDNPKNERTKAFLQKLQV